jgi:hypothetical protein
MIYARALDAGTTVQNLRVERVHRTSPTLTYLVRCIRPGCGGQFEISHGRLVDLTTGWCQWPGCSQAERERANRATYPVRRGELDPNALTIPGRVPW